MWKSYNDDCTKMYLCTLLIHINCIHLSREISRAAGKMVTGTYDETIENDAK